MTTYCLMLVFFFYSPCCCSFFFFFFFNDTATTEIYTLSLHDALPIFRLTIRALPFPETVDRQIRLQSAVVAYPLDRKSTRLNSSHGYISYAVFCLKKKTEHRTDMITALYSATRLKRNGRVNLYHARAG